MDVGFDKPNICALIIGTELEIVGKLENQRDRVRRMKIFDMDMMKRVSSYSTLFMYILIWPTVSSWAWFRVWFTFYVYVYFRFNVWLLEVNRVYRFCDYPPGRVISLVRLAHFSYERFGVVSNCWCILVILHTQFCLCEFIGELPWKSTAVR